MEIASTPSSATPQAAPAPQPTQAAPPAAAAGTENLDRFKDLVQRANNAGGGFSETEQLDAFQALNTMAVTGGMRGFDPDTAKLWDGVVKNSAVAQKVSNAQQGYALAMISGAQTGGASGARQAALDYFDKLGGSDQDALFRGNINAADMSGATKYADVNSWRTSMLAGIKLDQFVESASAKGDPYAQAKNDPKLAAALKLSESKDQSATWAQQIADLLGGRDPIKDKVDLSDAAKKVVGDATATTSGKTTSYEAGSLASKTI